MPTNNACNISASGLVQYNGSGTFSAVSITQNAMLYGGATNSITSTSVAADGALLIGASSAAPALNTLTAGSGISIANGTNSITISSTAAGIGSWSTVAGTSQSMAVSTGYIVGNASLTTFTLPALASVGQLVAIVGKGAGGWTLVENALQLIYFGTSTTTTTTGSLSSTNSKDVIFLICITANTTWSVIQSVGNLTVV